MNEATTQQQIEDLFAGIPRADAPKEGAYVEEDFISEDHRTCDCPLTYVHRKRHAALGTGIQIRLCCMARFIEQQFDLPEGTFFRSIDFEPSWVWDCDHVSITSRQNADGSISQRAVRLGPPPRWLRERMEQKGIEIRNLPAHEESVWPKEEGS
jgi:hypothetical protein